MNYQDTVQRIDTLTGTAGNDTVKSLVAGWTVQAGGGSADLLDLSKQTGGSNETGDLLVSLRAGTASKTGVSMAISGFEQVYGGTGNDTFRGDNENNLFDGKGGVNWADYSQETLIGINANLATNLVTGYGEDTLVAINNLLGSQRADFVTLAGAAANNVIDTKDEYDTVTYAGATDKLSISLASDMATGTSTVTSNGSQIGTDQLIGVEKIVGGGNDDTFYRFSAIDIDGGTQGSKGDTVNYQGDNALTVNLHSGTATDGTAVTQRLANIENAFACQEGCRQSAVCRCR